MILQDLSIERTFKKGSAKTAVFNGRLKTQNSENRKSKVELFFAVGWKYCLIFF